MSVQLVWTLLIISVLMVYWFCNVCYFCKSTIGESDRMHNGRIRFRKRGTNFPVCKSCARKRRGEVE